MRAIKDRMVRSYRFLFLFLVLVSLIFSLFFIFLFHSVSSSLHVVPSCHRRRIEKRRMSCRSHQKVRLQLSLSLSPLFPIRHTYREKESSIDRFFFPRFFSLSLSSWCRCVCVCVSFFPFLFLFVSVEATFSIWEEEWGWCWFFLPLLVISSL